MMMQMTDDDTNDDAHNTEDTDDKISDSQHLQSGGGKVHLTSN